MLSPCSEVAAYDQATFMLCSLGLHRLQSVVSESRASERKPFDKVEATCLGFPFDDQSWIGINDCHVLQEILDLLVDRQ